MSTTPQQIDPTPRVTAVILTWNQAAALRGLLDSLAQQDGKELLETLVMDAGSQDGGGQIDVDYPWITMLRMPHHFGRARSWNIAVKAAKGDILWFCSRA